MRRLPVLILAAVLVLGAPFDSFTQSTALLPTAVFHAIRDESSGELPLVDFQNIVTRFTGFSPSKGGDQIAEYLAGRMREYGLEEVGVEGFPSDGKTFFWTFLGEPAWEAEAGVLQMVEPRGERLADFAAHRVVLGRYSTSADVTTDLVDAGDGTSAGDYQGKDVKGKIALVTGDPQVAHGLAVWERGAVGLVCFRTMDPARPHLISGPGLGNKTGVPGLIAWQGPRGEPPGFLFGVSQIAGTELRSLLRRGERVVLHAFVKATTGPGEYKQASAAIRGTDPGLKEVWIKGHSNYRNTGGGNNLTGVGATVEIARVLNTLIAQGTLPRPRRTIRFLWSAEHFVSTYQFYTHPERRERVFTFFSVDMTGFNPEKVDGYFRLYRLPHSMPHVLSEVAQEFVQTIGRGSQNTARAAMSGGFPDPIFAPTGTRDPFQFRVEEFWAPSDHEEMVEGSIGVPSVEFGHPDSYIGTQEDNLDKLDATQMRRSVVIIASTAYYLASVGRDDLPRLAPVLLANAHARMGREAGRALEMMEMAPSDGFAVQYREARNVLAQSLRRELATIDSLQQIDRGPSVAALVARLREQLEAAHAVHDAGLRDRVTALASERKSTMQEPVPSPAERQLDTLVPTRNDAVRGPVNLWRPEYGSIWIARKTGNPDVLGQVPLTRRGRFVAYEALNFVDGRRTLLEIRDAVSAEYGPLDAIEVEQYFRFLERLGVVSIAQVQRTAR